ncbi:site-specific recombinase XerD [Murinocardiopsis flavida]|uniref:Site-specific recombinase XerD n=2 Tax=Murinocardiopsis flavida TaxID=645275 RepID=A0A2P8CR21_9ACTN|nr:site-specific recombinase XerD [Murinocardiopsis flavida]
MRNGVRKVRRARESRKAGKDVIAYKVPYRDASGFQTSKTWDRWTDAKNFRDKVRSQKNEGILEDFRSTETVRQVAEQWFSTVEAVRRPSTVDVYRSLLHVHILPAFGDAQVRAVRKGDIQAVVDRWSKTRAVRSVHLTYSMVTSIFQAAVDQGLIPRTPCTRILLPEMPDSPVVPLTPTQVWDIAAVLHVQPLVRMMVLLGAMTGLRAGELRGLTWECVDLDGGVLRVTRQAQRRELCAPKTKSARRSVPLSPLVVDLLREYRGSGGGEVCVVPVRKAKPAKVHLLFPAPEGGVQTDQWFRRRFDSACTAAGVEESNPHALRHTFAAVMIDKNENPRKLQAWLGHSSITTTMNIYGKLYPSSDDSARSAIDTAFGAAC